MDNDQLKSNTRSDQKKNKLYNIIIPIDVEKDKIKGAQGIIEEIYDHTTAKTSVNRNMIAYIHARDPQNFKEDSEEVNKVC